MLTASQHRPKLYLLTLFLSLALLFYSLGEMAPLIVDVEDFLGLTSHLPISYWIGLLVLLGASVLAFYDTRLKSDALYLTILITLGLFLLGPGVFAFENTLAPAAYYPTSEVKTLLATSHLDPSEVYHPAAYRSWPALHFLTAAILLLPGLGLDFVKYAPIAWVIVFVSITYSLGRRLQLPSRQSFLLSFLAVSSFWGFHTFYGAPMLGGLLLLLLLMILLTVRGVAFPILAMIAFATLVLTHGLTSLVLLGSLAMMSVYKRQTRFIVLFSVVFLSWYLYQAPHLFESSLVSWLATPWENILRTTRLETYAAPAPMSRIIHRYVMLSYLAIYGISVATGVILLARQRITGQNREHMLSLLFWASGTALAVIGIGYEWQTETRLYAFAVVPLASMTALWLGKAKIPLIVLMVAFVLLHPLARYGAIGGYGQVLTTELRGAEFFALKAKPERFPVYSFDPALVFHYNPDLITIGWSQAWLAPSSKEVDLSELDEAPYVLLGQLGSNAALFRWGEDPFRGWLQTDRGKRASLLYDNGYFAVYANAKTRPEP